MLLKKFLSSFKPVKIQEAYKHTFRTTDGELVLKHLSHLCGLDSVTYCPNNQYETAFKEGQRRVVLHILNMINMDIQSFVEDDYDNDFYYKEGEEKS